MSKAASKASFTTQKEYEKRVVAEKKAKFGQAVYAACVRGRNKRVTPTLQRLLTYDVLVAVITDTRLEDTHIDVQRQFVRIVTDLYVDNDIYDGGPDGAGCPPLHRASRARAPPCR